MNILYKTTNLVNGKIYIGIHSQSTDNFDGYLGSGQNLKMAIDKYGIDNFTRETIAVYDTWNEARTAEREIVTEEFCKCGNTYNISVGGQGGNTVAGYTQEELLDLNSRRGAAISKIKQEQMADPNYKQKYKDIMLANRIQPDNRNRKHSKETIETYTASCHSRGKKWYTNGNESLLVLPDESPVGLYEGRTLETDQKFKGHSDDILQELSKKRKGKIWVSNGETTLLVLPTEIPLGYTPGLRRKTNRITVWINNGFERKRITKGDAVPQGWELGRGNFKKEQ